VNRNSVPFTGLLVALLAVLLAAGAPARAEVTYPHVLPGVELAFPRDEGAHPEYRVEWWYVTGWLDDGGSEPIGFQVTFFRVRPGFAESNPSSFAPKQILFGHAAIAEPAHGKLRHAERSARAGFDLAYAREGGVDVRIDDWSLRRDRDVYRADVAGSQPTISVNGSGRASRSGSTTRNRSPSRVTS